MVELPYMDNQIKRTLEAAVLGTLSKDKAPAVVLYGPRRVGKTTIAEKVMAKMALNAHYFACDNPDVSSKLSNIGLTELTNLVKPYQLLVFDEAQRVLNIGNTLKLITDYLPEKKVLVTSSSSLNLANTITEPLTGRKKSYFLYPLALSEIMPERDDISLSASLSNWMRFGLYPQVHQLALDTDKADYLTELSNDYLYRDALHFIGSKNTEDVRKLLVAIALQIGQEVSYTELAQTVGMDHKTVIRYIELLEESFVIVRLSAFSRNLRTELKKTRKIYFYDVGVRNALLRNFNSFELRNDTGHVWENFAIIERMKRDAYAGIKKNYYFWRTHDQKEVDLIEESGGVLTAIEIKWKDEGQTAGQKSFIQTYPDSNQLVLNATTGWNCFY